MLSKIFTSGYEGANLFAVLVAYILALLFAISIHEFAHSFVAYKQGDDTSKIMGRMTINPLAHLDLVGGILLLLVGFGWAKPVQTNPLKYKKIKSGIVKVSLAGIIANFITAVIFSFLYVLAFLYCDQSTLLGFFAVVLCRYLCIISFVLGVFNLLPIAPLDGFSFLKAFVRMDNPFMEFMNKYGFIILIILLITPIFDYILNFLINYTLNPLINLWSSIL